MWFSGTSNWRICVFVPRFSLKFVSNLTQICLKFPLRQFEANLKEIWKKTQVKMHFLWLPSQKQVSTVILNKVHLQLVFLRQLLHHSLGTHLIVRLCYAKVSWGNWLWHKHSKGRCGSLHWSSGKAGTGWLTLTWENQFQHNKWTTTTTTTTATIRELMTSYSC